MNLAVIQFRSLMIFNCRPGRGGSRGEGRGGGGGGLLVDGSSPVVTSDYSGVGYGAGSRGYGLPGAVIISISYIMIS